MTVRKDLMYQNVKTLIFKLMIKIPKNKFILNEITLTNRRENVFFIKNNVYCNNNSIE